jgi:DNA-binding beta-propeller fold protein YncE
VYLWASLVGIAFNPHKGKMHVTIQNSNTVSSIEILTNTVMITMCVNHPHDIDFNTTMDTCVTTAGRGAVNVVYTATNTVVATAHLGSFQFPIGIAFNPN